MVEGVGVWYLYEISCGFMRETYSDIHLEIIKVSLVAVKQTWI
jgi:hypothetical protein